MNAAGRNSGGNRVHPEILQGDIAILELGPRKVVAVARPEGYEGEGRTREEAVVMLARTILTRLRVRQQSMKPRKGASRD